MGVSVRDRGAGLLGIDLWPGTNATIDVQTDQLMAPRADGVANTLRLLLRTPDPANDEVRLFVQGKTFAIEGTSQGIGNPASPESATPLIQWNVATGAASVPGGLLFPDGSVTAPGIAFASEPGLGFYRAASDQMGWTSGQETGKVLFGLENSPGNTYIRGYDGSGNAAYRLYASPGNPTGGLTLVGGGTAFGGLGFVNAANIDGAIPDMQISHIAAGVLGIHRGHQSMGIGNGEVLNYGILQELTTIAAAATTDTAIQLPANAVILGVTVRVTTAIPTAATFTVGDSGSAARFNTGASVSTALNTTNPGTKAGAYYNATATPVRITPNATPGTNVGRLRVTIFYYSITPSTQ